ncbi:uncharacterized protein PG998_011654 [Apiospora kogelbergensis]|uniref:Antifungal protein n=1 Tax=Apiospora kogelbergensis TaxID=1337665 RepID=A0AAW0RB90_9PEZI
MQFSTVTLFLVAAMGAIATPVNSADGVEARAEQGTLLEYTGTCTKAKNECKFKGQTGATTFVKCPTKPNNHRCFRDGNKCTFDSYSRKVVCT